MLATGGTEMHEHEYEPQLMERESLYPSLAAQRGLVIRTLLARPSCPKDLSPLLIINPFLIAYGFGKRSKLTITG